MKEQLKKIRNRVKLYIRKRNFLSQQKNTFELSKSQIKKANKLGFTADEYVIYDLEHNDPGEYISEFERECFRDAVRDYRILLDNKIAFYSLIRNFASTNEIYAYKVNGCYVSMVSGFQKENILEKVKACKMIVFKEIGSGGGIGFRLLSFSGGYMINREIVDKEEIENLLNRDNYLLEEYCCQGAFENKMWPYSVNTIRIITLYFNDTIQIAAALQRIGMDEKKCVDNACAGGLYSVIDIHTGCLSAAHSHSKENLLKEDGTKKQFLYHPITKSKIEGVIIPNWLNLCDYVIELHRKLSFTGIEFLAWDIALTDEGYKIIEANTSCSMDFLQTCGGVRNEIIGQWMKAKGYIE